MFEALSSIIHVLYNVYVTCINIALDRDATGNSGGDLHRIIDVHGRNTFDSCIGRRTQAKDRVFGPSISIVAHTNSQQ